VRPHRPGFAKRVQATCPTEDVARGGIRIIRSRNREAYSINQRNLFDENYALASTQALKNKDIPEGGAKGVILPECVWGPATR
jgi:NAD-specific glutamate dehydrogenase